MQVYGTCRYFHLQGSEEGRLSREKFPCIGFVSGPTEFASELGGAFSCYRWSQRARPLNTLRGLWCVSFHRLSNFISCMALFCSVTTILLLLLLLFFPFYPRKCLALSKSPPERRHELSGRLFLQLRALPSKVHSGGAAAEKWVWWRWGGGCELSPVGSTGSTESTVTISLSCVGGWIASLPSASSKSASLPDFEGPSLSGPSLPVTKLSFSPSSPPVLWCRKADPRCCPTSKVCSVASLRSLHTLPCPLSPSFRAAALGLFGPPSGAVCLPLLFFFQTQSVSLACS